LTFFDQDSDIFRARTPRTASAVLDRNHFQPDIYPEYVRLKVPEYDELEDTVADSTGAPAATRILDLGSGTGETARRVLERHPNARIVLVDSSAEMLAAACEALAEDRVESVLVQQLEDPLPPGPFDLVVSALAVHHLESVDKKVLFQRIAGVLKPGGRFVLADVIVAQDPELASTPVASEFDRPDRLDDQLTWMAEAGFEARVVWSSRDLAVIAARRPDMEAA
jgi:tRNA (cmo5U34)-methyltransferase